MKFKDGEAFAVIGSTMIPKSDDQFEKFLMKRKRFLFREYDKIFKGTVRSPDKTEYVDVHVIL